MSGLPLKRVETIMKTSDGSEKVQKDAVQLVADAAKLLIMTLTKEAHKVSNKAKKLQYEHLVDVIHDNSRYEFLEIIIPRKIKVRDFLAMRAKAKEEQESDSESETSESETDDDSSSSDSGSNDH